MEQKYTTTNINGETIIDVEPEKKPNKKKGRGFFLGFSKLIASGLVFGLVAGAAFQGVSIVKDQTSPSSTAKIESSANVDVAEDAKAGTGSVTTTQATDGVVGVVEKVMPSVVSITGKFATQSFFGVQETEGAGSGFIIGKDKDKLYIATNAHVVNNGSDLTVGFVDESTAPAKLVHLDSSADLAVISVDASQISEETAGQIKIAVLNDNPSAVTVGMNVVAIGNALGYGQSVTTGIISATNREVGFTDGSMSLLQTDAAINPGNSGGVLCNLNGEVIGINNSKLADTSVEGMCYAIPMSTAKGILESLMNAETISEADAAYIGIVGKTIDSSYSEALNIPEGIYISEVSQGSPAEKAGLCSGDVIVAFDGQSVMSMEGLKQKLSLKKAGTEVTITVKRANQNGTYEEQDVKVTLGKASENKETFQNEPNQKQVPDQGYNEQPNQNEIPDNGNEQEEEGNGGYDIFGNGGNYSDIFGSIFDQIR